MKKLWITPLILLCLAAFPAFLPAAAEQPAPKNLSPRDALLRDMRAAMKKRGRVYLLFYSKRIESSAAVIPQTEKTAARDGAQLLKVDAGELSIQQVVDDYRLEFVPTLVTFERRRGITGFHHGKSSVKNFLAGRPAPVPKTTKKLQEAIAKNASDGKITLLEFYASWCGTCADTGRIIKKAEKEARGSFVILRVDMDEDKETPPLYNVEAPPDHFVIDTDGLVVARFRTIGSAQELLAGHIKPR